MARCVGEWEVQRREGWSETWHSSSERDCHLGTSQRHCRERGGGGGGGGSRSSYTISKNMEHTIHTTTVY